MRERRGFGLHLLVQLLDVDLGSCSFGIFPESLGLQEENLGSDIAVFGILKESIGDGLDSYGFAFLYCLVNLRIQFSMPVQGRQGHAQAVSDLLLRQPS